MEWNRPMNNYLGCQVIHVLIEKYTKCQENKRWTVNFDLKHQGRLKRGIWNSCFLKKQDEALQAYKWAYSTWVERCHVFWSLFLSSHPSLSDPARTLAWKMGWHVASYLVEEKRTEPPFPVLVPALASVVKQMLEDLKLNRLKFLLFLVLNLFNSWIETDLNNRSPDFNT